MAELHRCAKCGNVLSDTLGGHCPRCLLQEGLAESSAGPPALETAAYQSRPAETAVLRPSVLPSRDRISAPITSCGRSAAGAWGPFSRPRNETAADGSL